jgi:Ca-activated chloride channel homolog
MSLHPSDAWIDDELKNVAVPGVVIHKLHAIASLDDAELDRALCDVAPTAELLERLRSIGSLDENDLNDELRHVVLPVTLAERLRQIPLAIERRVASGVFVRRLAIAASLLVAMGVGYIAAVAPSYFSRQHRQTAETGPTAAGKTQSNGRQSTGRSGAPSPAIGNGDVELAKSRSRDESANSANSVVPPEQDIIPRNDRSAAQVADDRKTTAPDADNPQITSDILPPENVLGANIGIDRLPPLESLPPPVWRGVTPPRDIGYDWRFQFKYNVHPLVPPARPALVDCPVPLVTSTDSFDEALRLTAQRKLPPPDKIRPEEFLAAMDYGFSPPEGSPLAVRTAVGPSPWVATGSSLLQVAAQARVLSRDRDSQSHIIVVLDASATMGWERRWQNVLAGLRQYVERMQPADRLTLIVMGENAEIVAERKAPAEALVALDALPAQPAAKMVNLLDALRLATGAADRGLSDGPGRIVLLTDGGLGLEQRSLEQIDTVFKSSLGDAGRFEVFDVRQEETIDAELSRLAEAAKAHRVGDGGVAHVAAAGDLRWRLLELATGKSQLVATKATMKVKFKPDAVARYRLIGHEATSMATTVAGLNSATVEADLRSGEAATGLFEVYLKPDGGETIATVEVTWKDPKTGAAHKAEQNITRLQLAPSFHQGPLSLQMAALAAETAEILRNSFFAPPNSHSLSHVAELGALLNTRLRSRPSFARLMTLIEQAESSR